MRGSPPLHQRWHIGLYSECLLIHHFICLCTSHIMAAFVNCILDVRGWCASRRLQLNTQKTEQV